MEEEGEVFVGVGEVDRGSQIRMPTSTRLGWLKCGTANLDIDAGDEALQEQGRKGPASVDDIRRPCTYCMGGKPWSGRWN